MGQKVYNPPDSQFAKGYLVCDDRESATIRCLVNRQRIPAGSSPFLATKLVMVHGPRRTGTSRLGIVTAETEMNEQCCLTPFNIERAGPRVSSIFDSPSYNGKTID